jgi:hypothetical protein
MRLRAAAQQMGVVFAALGLAAAGLVTSSLVSISLWVALALSGGAINALVILGALLGIAAWLGALFLAVRVGGRVLGKALTPRTESVLVGSVVGGVVVGAAVRKVLQFSRPELFPSPEAYAWFTLPLLAAGAGAFWALSGQDVPSSETGASPSQEA